MTPVIFLIQTSTFFTLSKVVPIFFAQKAIIIEKIITGIPVPIENNNGANIGLFDKITSGINIPKNIIPLYGQKAKANKALNSKEPR